MDCPGIINELQNALSLIMSPHTDPNLRRTAYQYCEDFKDKSENCAECGVFMARVENDQIIRHFGLQLLEHCIKFKWNDMSLDKKQYIKTNALSLISSGTLDISSEHSHIKDALSRIVVEIAKREWPQQWMFMINELDAISSRGMTQTEIVLMIFLRLVEDVLIFQTTPSQRRKEISQGLTAIMNQLFAFFCSTLASNYASFKSNRNDPGYAKVIGVTCEVVCAFMENLSINLLISDNGSLIFLLLDMLQEAQLNSPVADCLLEIASKKGKIEERTPLIDIFLKMEVLNKLEQVAITNEKNCINEQGFTFFKKLCQVLVVIGTQICSIQAHGQGSKFPSNFDKYIGLMLSFTIHPSQAISCYCMPLWMSLLKCSKYIEQEIIKRCMSQIFSNSIDLMLRNGSPSQDNHIRCIYSKFDFDCDEEFSQFQRKYKADVCDVIRIASALFPEQAFEFITVRLAHLLDKTFNSGQQESMTNMTSLYAEWEVVGSCLEAVVEKMDFKNMKGEVVLSTITLYKQILEFHSPDPTLCSDILSVTSAFFPIISQDPSILPKVLDKLFACMLFNIPGQTKSTRSKIVKNVRRHACSILIKICKMYPLLLLPGFNYLYDHIKKLTTDPEELSQMEKSTCFEALILIHNEVKNYNEQANFLREIIQQISPYWLSDSVTETLWSSDKLMDFVGITRPPVEPSSQDVCGINRSQIQYCLSLIMGVLKRSAWPSSVEEAQKGGFILKYTSDMTPTYRSPAAEIIIPLLNNVFGIIKSYHEIFQTDEYKKIYPAFLPALQLAESEKYNLLGIVKPQSDISVATTKDPVDRMQAFFNTMAEAGYNILGNSCKFLNVEFYGFPSVENVVLHSVLANVFILPEFRIKHLIHTFLKPFVQNCPKEYYSKVLLVVLKAICPVFYQYLTSRWQAMSNKRNNDSQDCTDSQESQEMLEDQVLRSLTKEYVDVIDCLMRDRKSMTSGSPQQQQQSSSSSLEMCDDAMMDDGDAASLNRKAKEDVLGELGRLILEQEDVYPSIVLLIFVSLSWEDSTICGKTIIWCYPILKQLASLQKVTNEFASDFLRSIFYGLNIHGQHDSVLFLIINALLQTYELLVVNFPSITEILLKIPGCTSENLNNFNSRFIFTKSQGKGFEKKKREHFKSLVEGAVEKNIGQRYKNPVHIKNLAPFRLFRQKQKELLLQEDAEDVGLCTLFSGDKN